MTMLAIQMRECIFMCYRCVDYRNFEDTVKKVAPLLHKMECPELVKSTNSNRKC